MPEDTKEQLGDGQDDFGQAARQLASAAKSAGASAGADAAANAAGALVKAGVESGKAVSGVAVGTAAGGPWGAILAAAWSMRHTLFRVLVCVCMVLLIFVVLIISLPSIITNSLFGLDGNPGADGSSLLAVYTEMAGVVTDVIEEGHERAQEKVEQLIADGGYDYDLSMDALEDTAQYEAGFDTCYVLAAYSASMEQQGTSKEDMIEKLREVIDDMFPVTTEERQEERSGPASYRTYRAVSVTVVTGRTASGYTTATKTYYLPDGENTTEAEITVPAYKSVTVAVPVWSGGRITGTTSETYYERDGTQTISPEVEIVKYLACTIHPFDNTVITRAFDIDITAPYGEFNITVGEAIQHMADALKMTLYGSLGGDPTSPLTDEELIAFVNAQNCNATRKYILATALSLVGRVPYFWGGKSPAGWDSRWNTPMLVTAPGSPSSGTIRPYGLDCSGFAMWVFDTCFGIYIGAGCNNQYTYTYEVTADELLPGDLGFYWKDGEWNHILIFAGYDENGTRMWVHCTNGGGVDGVVLNSPSYEGSLSLRRSKVVDYNAPVPEDIEPIHPPEGD